MVLDFLETNPMLFNIAFLAVALYLVLALFVGGRKAEAQFGKLSDQTIVFRERGASGYSTKSMITRFGGASRVLDVIVTTGELWIKGIWPAFTYIGTMYDLTHRVPLANIREATAVGQRVSVRFVSSAATETNVELRLRDPKGFLEALDA